MPVFANGTRQVQTTRGSHPAQGSNTRFNSEDVGLNKNVTAAITFTTSAPHLTGANGTFSNFAVGDTVIVEGTNLNNGIKIITAIDTTHSSYLTTDYPAKAEGPISATVRTV